MNKILSDYFETLEVTEKMMGKELRILKYYDHVRLFRKGYAEIQIKWDADNIFLSIEFSNKDPEDFLEDAIIKNQLKEMNFKLRDKWSYTEYNKKYDDIQNFFSEFEKLILREAL